MGVFHPVLPMTDSPVHTFVSTVERGVLPFQEYFVKYQCAPTMKGVNFEGIETASLSAAGKFALDACDTVVICPSNPWVSISPILEIQGVKESLLRKTVVAVSPLIGGKTVKGPAAKMYAEMGIMPSAVAIAHHYEGLIQGLIIDKVDEDQIPQIRQCGIIPIAENTLMSDNQKRIDLAKQVHAFCERLKKG
jgi:LPPG:FO 2-phospho-L-lactate transferase